ncbi:unnamed protein product [Candidula unifasciata]|uniref:Peptidylglycine monooxygenase n=1 Tax=Candidula unifasciata TaxID=100452 RepID=A0A8S3Z2F4_9EUPU|nr:unnamed protein product [Candidula unifasciata]
MFALVTTILMLTSTVSSAPKSPICDVTKDPDIKFVDIRLTKTKVPPILTSYVCQAQPIPLAMDVAYHAVAFEPIIENKDVVHHMLLFGCEKSVSEDPHACSGSDNVCRTFLVQWSMGIQGQICSHPDTGVRFGQDSLHSLSLQIHYNNAKLAAGLADSSGVRVYYTTRLRKYDAGNVQIGQNDLQIPPGVAAFPQYGFCSSDCTNKWLQQPIYLTRAHIHMHYVGDGGRLELVRNGQTVETIINDTTTFDYNNPPAHYFSDPVQVLPGDSLKVTCYYNTRDGGKYRNSTVYWDEGSSGEMCYAFITYFPRVPDFDQCIQFDVYDICSSHGGLVGGCSFGGFARSFKNILAESILSHCSLPSTNQNVSTSVVQQKADGLDLRILCSPSCEEAIQQMTGHPCMQNRVGSHMRRVYLAAVDSWQAVKVIIDTAAKHCAD